jgi:hypothetical protein
MRQHSAHLTVFLITCAYAVGLSAQLITIPEQLMRAGESLASGPAIPSGPPPSIDRVLNETGMIVRGVVGEPRSYLSDDKLEIYSDYPLRTPTILYQATMTALSKPGMPGVTVTAIGGAVTLNGLTFTSTHDALPHLEVGTECLFLLKRVGEKYFIAGTYYGAFRIVGGTVTPLAKTWGFAPELRGAPVDVVAADVVARVTALQRRR